MGWMFGLLALLGLTANAYGDESAGGSVGPAWERLADMPTAVAAPAGSKQGRRAVLTGGVILGGGVSDAVQAFDLDGLTWSQPTRLVTPRYQHAQVTLADGRILVLGGRRSRQPGQAHGPIASCELIDADLSKTVPTADLPMAMSSPTVHLLSNGQALAVGNHVAAVFDPVAESWEPVAPLIEPRREHDSVLLDDGTVLVGGGIGRATFERINPATHESVHLQARLPDALDDLAMVLLADGRVWVIGGQHLNGQTTDETWLLTVGEDGDSSLAPGPDLGLEHGVADHVVVQTPHGLVVAGGESQNGRRDTELASAMWLDPIKLTVRLLPATDIAHDDAVGLSDGGWALVFGGQVDGSLLGVAVPTPIRAAHRIRLPAAGH